MVKKLHRTHPNTLLGSPSLGTDNPFLSPEVVIDMWGVPINHGYRYLMYIQKEVIIDMGGLVFCSLTGII